MGCLGLLRWNTHAPEGAKENIGELEGGGKNKLGMEDIQIIQSNC